MYDIKPLEEEWKIYQKNKRMPWLIGILVAIIIGIVSFYAFSNTLYNFNTLSNLSIFKKKETSKVINLASHKSIGVVNNALLSLETNSLKVSIPITKQIENENILVDIPILDINERTPVSYTTTNSVSKERKKVHLNIIETTNVTAYKDVERRFRESHDTDDSLFLAKSYYKKGKYKKAEYWAYETNKINANIAEGLFIFVKAKVKLGKRNEALSILGKYIKRTNSYEAKNLLNKIENHRL